MNQWPGLTNDMLGLVDGAVLLAKACCAATMQKAAPKQHKGSVRILPISTHAIKVIFNLFWKKQNDTMLGKHLHVLARMMVAAILFGRMNPCTSIYDSSLLKWPSLCPIKANEWKFTLLRSSPYSTWSMLSHGALAQGKNRTGLCSDSQRRSTWCAPSLIWPTTRDSK